MTARRRYLLAVLLPVIGFLIGATTLNIAASRNSRTVRGGALPLMFEKGTEGEYVARSRGYSVLLSRTGASIALPVGEALPAALVNLTFDGAGTESIEGADRLDTLINYLKGPAAAWRTNVQTYGRVRMRRVYPGIDAIFYGTDRHVEYDFIVEPGADPGAISMTFSGADRVTHDVDGNLVISAGGREVRQHRPVAYQEIGGSRSRVAADYQVDGATVRLVIGEYDRTRTLIIDPVLSHSTFWSSDKKRALTPASPEGLGRGGSAPCPLPPKWSY